MWGRRLLMVGGLALTAWISLSLSRLVLDDALIVLRYRAATATVLEVGPARRSGSALAYAVRLRIAEPGAPPREAWADRALRIPVHWHGPPRRPEPGDAIAAYVDGAKPRIVPADSIYGFWVCIGTLVPPWFLTILMVRAVRRHWGGDGPHHNTGTP